MIFRIARFFAQQFTDIDLSRITKVLGISVALLSAGIPAFAQTGRQLWMEWQVSYPFANRYLVENTLAYQTLLAKNEKWSSISMSPTFEMTLLPKLDLTAEVPLGYTHQTNSLSSFEISPIIGARFHVTQNRKIDIRLLTRFQSRNVHQIEADVWEHKGRFRVKGEVWYSINRPNLFTDNLWYTFLDYEEFVVVDDQVKERFANLRRARVGLGYRLNYMHRLDLIYTWQYSRDEIGSGFDQTDSVIQLKYKMFLNPSPAIANR